MLVEGARALHVGLRVAGEGAEEEVGGGISGVGAAAEGEVALREGGGIDAQDVPHVEAADLYHVATVNPGEVVREDAVACLGVVGLHTDTEPAPEIADGDPGKTKVTVVEGLSEEAGGNGELSGGEEIDLLVCVGEACGIDDGGGDVVGPAEEGIEGWGVDGGSWVGRGIVVVAGRADVVDLLMHVTEHELVFGCDVFVYSVDGVVLTV